MSEGAGDAQKCEPWEQRCVCFGLDLQLRNGVHDTSARIHAAEYGEWDGSRSGRSIRVGESADVLGLLLLLLQLLCRRALEQRQIAAHVGAREGWRGRRQQCPRLEARIVHERALVGQNQKRSI